MKSAALVGAGLCLPRRGHAGPPPSVRRLLIVHAPGGIRFTSTFDAQPDPQLNPWGVLPWRLVGRGKAPAWSVGRMMVQRPLPQSTTDWTDKVYPYLSSDDPSHHNVFSPALATWGGARLPSFVDVARDIAVVRVASAPGTPFNSDHESASHTLMTGSRAGETGVVTAFMQGLKEKLGSGYEARYPLPAVVVGYRKWSLGPGERPINLLSASDLPQAGGGEALPPSLLRAEETLDRAFRATRQERTAEEVTTLLSDRKNADKHVPQLLHPALRFAPVDGAASPALGACIDGTPVTSAMLAELFALDPKLAPKGDIAQDAFSALEQHESAFGPRTFGHSAAFAVRLLQIGAPVVSVSIGLWDTHANEVLDTSTHRPHTVQAVMLGRTLAALSFALGRIADPSEPGASLWDSTAVVVCSEFGRGGDDVGKNGFNTPHGENGGGSDHSPWAAWPIFGGPISRAGAGGRLIVAPDGRGFHEQNRVFTTLLRGMGIGRDEARSPALTAQPVIPGLIAGVA